jgi:mannose-6-phosphate isomerase-like protein (cupin superfamily)
MKKVGFWMVCWMGITASLLGQQVHSGKVKPEKELENITPYPLFSDPHATSVLLWIKKGVKPHYHASHSEHVVVLKGKGLMQLGEDSFEIRKGDIIFIPQGTVHAVTVQSGTLKVISIQAPQFDGSDRVMVE